MRKILIALLALLVLLVVAVLVGPSFVDWNSQKDRITAEVQELTDKMIKVVDEALETKQAEIMQV